MRLKDTQPAIKSALRSAAVLLVLSVAACEPQPAATAPAAQAQIPSDPLLAFVSSGRIGQSGVVVEPALGGSVAVVIDSQYNAASGDVCRTYSTTSSTLQSQHLACGSGADWQVVPPLVTSSN